MLNSKTTSEVLFILFMLFFSCPMHSQKIDNMNKYQIAYNYIKNINKCKGIKVSGTVIDLDRWVFPIDSLKDYPKEKEMLEATIKRKQSVRDDSFYSKEITALTPKSKKINTIIYFSPVEDDMLVVCLCPFDKRRHKITDIDNFDVICRFTTSKYFLFIFDEYNNIKKLLTVDVNIE